MTTPAERNGALEAIERIVNRGDDVVGETLAVLGRLYPSVSLREDGSLEAVGAKEDDEALLGRAASLISSESAKRSPRP